MPVATHSLSSDELGIITGARGTDIHDKFTIKIRAWLHYSDYKNTKYSCRSKALQHEEIYILHTECQGLCSVLTSAQTTYMYRNTTLADQYQLLP